MHSTLYMKSIPVPLNKWLVGWILCLPILAACSQSYPVVYSEFADIDGEGIPQNWEYTFSPVPFDSTEMETGLFDVILIVRYSNRCASKSVIFDVESFSLQQSRPDSAKLNVQLITPDGAPAGKGNWGVFEITDTLAHAIKIPEGYVISVSSPLDSKSTEGILDIGIKLLRSGRKEFNLPDIIRGRSN